MPSYCCSSSDFLQSHYTVLLSTVFCLFHAPPDAVVHFLIFLRSFRFESSLSQFSLYLSHRSRISAVTQFFFSSVDVCQGSHWLFQSLLRWRWWSLRQCMYLHCSWWWQVQNFPPIIAWKVCCINTHKTNAIPTMRRPLWSSRAWQHWISVDYSTLQFEYLLHRYTEPSPHLTSSPIP